jgi:hypothetical protein
VRADTPIDSERALACTSVEKMQTQIYFGITLPEKSASSWIRSEFGRPYL